MFFIKVRKQYLKYTGKLFAKIKVYFPYLPKPLKQFIFFVWKISLLIFRNKIPITSSKENTNLILKSLIRDGYIKVNKDFLYSTDEINILKRIKALSEKRIYHFENYKNLPNYKEELCKKKLLNEKCLNKPFRYDLGGYLNLSKEPVMIKKKDVFNNLLLHIGLKSDFLFLAREYLEVDPKLGRFYCWYDYPTSDKPTSTQKWHRDNDDIRFFKIFIALEKINENNGAHCFIKKTHNMGKYHKIKGYNSTRYNTFKVFEEDQLFKLISPELKTVANSNFGTTIFEDTSGIHCGIKPIKKSRLILSFEYFSRLSPHFVEFKIEDKDAFEHFQIKALQ